MVMKRSKMPNIHRYFVDKANPENRASPRGSYESSRKSVKKQIY